MAAAAGGYAYSPPFRDLSDEEERAVADDIARSGARLLFVGLGCPKQDWWTLRQLGRFPGVLLPVGAAFDFLAGTKSRPPSGSGARAWSGCTASSANPGASGTGTCTTTPGSSRCSCSSCTDSGCVGGRFGRRVWHHKGTTFERQPAELYC